MQRRDLPWFEAKDPPAVIAEPAMPNRREAPQRPAGRRISRETLPDGGVLWHVPPTGRGGVFFGFGIVWCGFLVLLTGGVIYTLAKGARVEGSMPWWMPVLMFAGFWAIGLGYLYAGLVRKYAAYLLHIDPRTVTLTRRLFGRAATQSLAREDVRDAALVEFYQRHHDPVRGLEIRADRGKLRFGAELTREEKRWLLGDIRAELFGAPAAGVQPLVRDHFAFVVPNSASRAMLAVLLITVLGGWTAFAHGYFTRALAPSHTQTVLRLVITGTISAGATAMLIGLARKRLQETRLEGTPGEVALRTYDRAGRVRNERVFPRPAVTDFRSRYSGSSGQKTLKRIELLTGAEMHPLCYWVLADIADPFVDEVRAALGWPAQPDRD